MSLFKHEQLTWPREECPIHMLNKCSQSSLKWGGGGGGYVGQSGSSMNYFKII